MSEVDREIKVKNEPPKAGLTHLETALTILLDLEAHIPEDSTFYPRLMVGFLSVQTLIESASVESL